MSMSPPQSQAAGPQHSGTQSSRSADPLKKFLTSAGILILLSGFVYRIYTKFYFVNHLQSNRLAFDSAQYWGLALGILIIAMAQLRSRARFKGASVLLVILGALSGLFQLDRLMLAGQGLPIWTYDSRRIVTYRPGTVIPLHGQAPERAFRINSFGFHDEEFPLEKPPNQIRGVALGDATTAGSRIIYQEAYPYLLQQLLSQRSQAGRSFKVINTGTDGYTTSNEYEQLRFAMRFKPDFVTLGFAMTDPEEVVIDNPKYGASLDEARGILGPSSDPWFPFYLESGFGRWIVNRKVKATGLARFERWLKLDYVSRRTQQDPFQAEAIHDAWSVVMDSMGKIFNLSKEAKVPLILLIFPYADMVSDPDNPANNQAAPYVRAFAEKHGISYIDFVEVFRGLVGRGSSLEENRVRALQYFLNDNVSFSAEGHRVIAETLLNFIWTKNIFMTGELADKNSEQPLAAPPVKAKPAPKKASGGRKSSGKKPASKKRGASAS